MFPRTVSVANFIVSIAMACCRFEQIESTKCDSGPYFTGPFPQFLHMRRHPSRLYAIIMGKIHRLKAKLATRPHEPVHFWNWLRLLHLQAKLYDPFSMTRPIFEEEMFLDAIYTGSIARRGSFAIASEPPRSIPQDRFMIARVRLKAIWIGDHPTPLLLEDECGSQVPYPAYRSMSVS
jgi:hypothetical protein